MVRREVGQAVWAGQLDRAVAAVVGLDPDREVTTEVVDDVEAMLVEVHLFDRLSVRGGRPDGDDQSGRRDGDDRSANPWSCHR
jgi:hypothetical protein